MRWRILVAVVCCTQLFCVKPNFFLLNKPVAPQLPLIYIILMLPKRKTKDMNSKLKTVPKMKSLNKKINNSLIINLLH